MKITKIRNFRYFRYYSILIGIFFSSLNFRSFRKFRRIVQSWTYLSFDTTGPSNVYAGRTIFVYSRQIIIEQRQQQQQQQQHQKEVLFNIFSFKWSWIYLT